VTRYAFAQQRRDLIATWGTGWGDVAHTVDSLPADPAEGPMVLATTLSTLVGDAVASLYPSRRPDGVRHRVRTPRRPPDDAEQVLARHRPTQPAQWRGGEEAFHPIEEAAHRVRPVRSRPAAAVSVGDGGEEPAGGSA